jgi:hypothetical protein
MRLVSGFEIVNHSLSMGLILATGGTTLWLWSQGRSASARWRRPPRWRCA